MNSFAKTLKLSNGLNMPMIGLGTFRTADSKKAFKESLKYAMSVGYRHIDGAWLYDNEEEIGEAIRESIDESKGTLKREDIFYVDKCWNTFHSKEQVRVAVKESLRRLGLDYIDLYLIHWPMGFKEGTGSPFPKENDKIQFSDVNYLETYAAMEELVAEGFVKSIGVSNFNVTQLQDVLDHCKIKPVNNQIELNPYLQCEKLIAFCQKNDIVVSAYGPIGAGAQSTTKPDLPILLEHPTISKLAEKYSKTPAQICLRWGIQKNVVMLPKSVTPSRILQNIQVFDFELTSEEMAELKSIDQNYRNYGVENLSEHKYYPFKE